jgi:hypothetical protein
MDEINKFVRGAVLASVEQLRVGAEAVGRFADEVAGRSEARAADVTEDVGSRTTGDIRERRDPVTELAANLPRDLYAGVLKAIDHSLTMPSRAVRAFNDSYLETERVQKRAKKTRIVVEETETPGTSL